MNRHGNMRPYRCVLCLVAGWICFASCWCRADAPPEVQQVTLPDGVRLLFKSEPSTDITAVTLFIRTPRDRSPEEEAIAEMVAHALFYGSTDRTRDGIALSVAQVGGVLETLYAPDYVAVTCVTVPEQIEEVARMLGEALKHADFTSDALARAQADILRARHDRMANGFEIGCDRARALLAGREPPPADQLRLVTHEEAVRYFTTHYVPAQTVISVVGRLAPSVVETAFRAYFAEYDRPARAFPGATSAWPPAGQSQTPALSQSPNIEKSVSEVVSISTGTAAYALVGTPAPSIESQDAPAFAVLHALLGVGHASRMFRQVRDILGFGYSVGASYRADLSDPLITYLQWDVQRAEATAAGNGLTSTEALRQLNAQLDGVLSNPPEETEIERARNVAIGHAALRHERVRDRAFLLGWYETMGPGYNYDNDFPHLLATVTRADVLRVAQKYLSHRACVAVTPHP